MKPMKYVYLLQSINHPNQRYIGLTANLQQRLTTHNQGGSPHTSKYAPWHIVTAIRFDNDQRASAFEHYLKTGSGRAFANKHFW
jgi:putative endonuclease